jgi:hypothetical protein
MNRTELKNSSPAEFPATRTGREGDIPMSPKCVMNPFVCETRPRLKLAFEKEHPILKEAPSRRVRFALDLEEKDTKSQYCMPAGVASTSQEKKNAWYSKKEINEKFQESQRLATEYREQHFDWLKDSSEQVLKFIDTSSQKGSIASTSASSEFTEVLNCHLNDCRGLERLVYPALSGHRLKYIKTLLATQSRIPENVQPELKAQVLRAKSLQLSKPWRVLASLLARGDSIEVINLVRDDLQKR